MRQYAKNPIAVAFAATTACSNHSLPILPESAGLLAEVQAAEAGKSSRCVDNHETSPHYDTNRRLRLAKPEDVVDVNRPAYPSDPADVQLIIEVKEMRGLYLSLVVRVRDGSCESYQPSEIWN